MEVRSRHRTRAGVRVILALSLALVLLEWPTILVCPELKSFRNVEDMSAK